MRTTTWTIEVRENDLQVLRRNMDAMQRVLREQELAPEVVDDFHQCLETLDAMLGRARPVG